METEEVNMSGRKSPGIFTHVERAGSRNTVVTGVHVLQTLSCQRSSISKQEADLLQAYHKGDLLEEN